MNKKNYTFSLNIERLKEMQEWFNKNKPIDYSSFNDFAEKALWREFQIALKKQKSEGKN